MTTLHPIPRRGTPVHRAWLLRAVLIGGLPLGTVLLSLASVIVVDTAQRTGETPWTELSAWAVGAWVAVAVLALVALFDVRTRLVAAVSLVIALIVNATPYIAEVIRAGIAELEAERGGARVDR